LRDVDVPVPNAPFGEDEPDEEPGLGVGEHVVDPVNTVCLYVIARFDVRSTERLG